MRFRDRYFIGASFVLHATLLFVLLKRRTPAPRTLQVVELTQATEFKARPKAPAPAARKKNVASSPSRKSARLSADVLNPFHDRANGTGSNEGIKSIVVGGDDAGAAWGDGGGDFKRIEDFGLMDHIYQRADRALFYPDVFARHSIEGWANARLVITAHGDCEWKRTRISATDPHLRVFVLSVLKEVCEENFRRFIGKRELTNIDLSFQFALTEHNDLELIQSKKMIVGNVLSFYRNAQHSVMQWRVGPFTGMFPIPAVALDFGWLQEHWETTVMKKAAPDPLREYRE